MILNPRTKMIIFEEDSWSDINAAEYQAQSCQRFQSEYEFSIATTNTGTTTTSESPSLSLGKCSASNYSNDQEYCDQEWVSVGAGPGLGVEQPGKSQSWAGLSLLHPIPSQGRSPNVGPGIDTAAGSVSAFEGRVKPGPGLYFHGKEPAGSL